MIYTTEEYDQSVRLNYEINTPWDTKIVFKICYRINHNDPSYIGSVEYAEPNLMAWSYRHWGSGY